MIRFPRFGLAAALLWFLGLGTVPLHAAGPDDPVLTLRAGERVVSIPRSRLQAELKARRLTVYHPDYGREMDYLAYPLAAVFALAGVSDGAGERMTWVFHCLDGYTDPVDAAALPELDLYLAVGENGVPGLWTPVTAGKEHNDPGPFLMVSTTGSRAGGFTWPYAVTEVRRLRFEERYADVIPRGVAADSPAARGFALFERLCLRCHSINLQGGTVGPELNIPLNITEYRDEAFLTAWIRDPGRFRARSRMPTLGLADEEIADLLAYLGHMKGFKVPVP